MVDNDDGSPTQAPNAPDEPGDDAAAAGAIPTTTDPDLQLGQAHRGDDATDPARTYPPARTPAQAQAAKAERDPALGAYIQALNLAEIDLSEVDLPERAAPSLGLLLAAAVVAVVAAAALLILPGTALVQLHGGGELLAWPLGLVLLGAVALGAKNLAALGQLDGETTAAGLAQAQGAAQRSAAYLGRTAELLGTLGQIVATALARWRGPLLAVGIAALVAALVFVLPHEAEWQGKSYSNGWFMAAAAALTCGILVGRFILVQAEASPLAADIKPWVLPSWFRWVTLALLVLAGLTASFGASWLGLGGQGGDGEFSLAGLGLVVGIGGAIWLARRFDELETKWRAEAEDKRSHDVDHD